MTESTLMREIMLAVSKTGARLFRNNSGMGWTGTIAADVQTGRGRVVSIGNPRPLHAGLCVGSSDLIGWTQTGRFLAIEVKTSKGRVTAEQQQFLDAVNRAGGIGCVARSVEEAIAALAQQSS